MKMSPIPTLLSFFQCRISVGFQRSINRLHSSILCGVRLDQVILIILWTILLFVTSVNNFFHEHFFPRVPVLVKKPAFRLISSSILVAKKWFDYQNVAIDHPKMFPKGHWLKIIIGNDRRIFMPKFCPSPLSKSRTLSRILVHLYVGIPVDKKKHNTQLKNRHDHGGRNRRAEPIWHRWCI